MPRFFNEWENYRDRLLEAQRELEARQNLAVVGVAQEAVDLTADDDADDRSESNIGRLVQEQAVPHVETSNGQVVASRDHRSQRRLVQEQAAPEMEQLTSNGEAVACRNHKQPRDRFHQQPRGGAEIGVHARACLRSRGQDARPDLQFICEKVWWVMPHTTRSTGGILVVL